MRLAMAGILVTLAFASPLAANWQYSKWGTTPSQVASASHGVATEPTDEERAAGSEDGNVPLLKAPWHSGSFEFTAYFYFTRGKVKRLTHVSLRLEQGDGHELLGALRQKYGKAVSTDESQTATLEVWHRNGDQVTYIAVADRLFRVTYQPLTNSDNSAL